MGDKKEEKATPRSKYQKEVRIEMKEKLVECLAAPDYLVVFMV